MTDNVLAFLRAALPWVVTGLLLAVFFARNTGSKKKEKEEQRLALMSEEEFLKMTGWE